MVYNRETEQYENRYNIELQRLYIKLNILSYTRIRRLQWLGHVWRADRQII